MRRSNQREIEAFRKVRRDTRKQRIAEKSFFLSTSILRESRA